MFDIFEALYWNGIVNAVSKLPKETIYTGIAAGVVLDRSTQLGDQTFVLSH